MFKPEKKFNNEEAAWNIGAALQSERGKQDARKYLGASRWGHHCERALGYEFHHTTRDAGDAPQFKPEILRIFDMGHDAETRMAEYMKLAGYNLQTHKPDGGQIGFKACEGKLAGHCDGIIHGGPDLNGIELPLVWECKALNNKSWNDTSTKGVKVSKPLYYSQMQTYIAYLDLKGYFFTAINRDSGEVFVEIGLPDMRQAQDDSDKALRVIQSGNPEELPRCASDETDWRCRFCDFAKRCWEKGETSEAPKKIQIKRPSWSK
jgi:hypothetical protein